jgi:thiosulfate/3-mercaptopyruvate sulfurtransferase
MDGAVRYHPLMPRPVLLVLLLALPLGAQPPSPLQWPPPRPAAVFPEILVTPEGLAAALGRGAVAVDARSPEAYRAGHIPGAVLGSGDFAETVIVYGDRESPQEVARRFWQLEAAGVPNVKILEGGVEAWKASGRPLKTGPAPEARSRIAAGPPRVTANVDVEWVERSYGEAGVELLDVRDVRGWDRWETPPTFGAGHIPYALPFDSGSFSDPVEFRNRMEAFGPRPGDPVDPDATFVIYGEGPDDPRLGPAYLALRRAGFSVRVFPGGWKEWTSDPARPVVRIVETGALKSLLEKENPGLGRDLHPPAVVLLDLREPRDFLMDHLPGAASLPFARFEDGFEPAVARGWPGVDRVKVPVVFYCYGRDCIRSRKAATQAVRLGFRNVLWYREGVIGWREAGLPFFENPLP